MIPNIPALNGWTKISIFVVETKRDQLTELSNYSLTFDMLNEVLPEKTIDFRAKTDLYLISDLRVGHSFELIFDLMFSEKVLGGESFILKLPSYE